MRALSNIPFLDDLRGFQKSAARWLDLKNGVGLLADPMGAGKTIETLAYLALYPELRPVLIVVPLVVKLKWKREIEKWMPWETPQVVDGNAEFKVTGSIVLINWDIIHVSEKVTNPKYILGYSKKQYINMYASRPELLETKWAVVVGDEIHKISNDGTARTKAFQQICKKKKKIIGLSGTPVENRPIDFLNILRILNPKLFGWRHFRLTYCGRTRTPYGWDHSGSSNLAELHGKVMKVMLRRDKAVILPELPPLQRIIIPVEIDNKKEYRTAKANYIEWLVKHKGLEKARSAREAIHFSKMETLKQLAVKGILKSAVTWIKDYLETEEKLVVGCIHTSVVDALYKEFGKTALKITGATKDKDAAGLMFQNNPKYRLAICNIEAAGLGIDLFAANSTLSLEYLWKPAPHDQFEARVHRIGQDASAVNAYYMIGVDTVMEIIAELIDEKRKVIDAIVDGRETEDIDLLTELLKRINEQSPTDHSKEKGKKGKRTKGVATVLGKRQKKQNPSPA
jgi:SWI/SNF-related matrix-associated actin-dependent regulator of chromatin subfamily A-like protein 1